MRPRSWLPGLLIPLYVSFSGSGPGIETERKEPQPNLVLIVLDDLGWGDLGCYGNDYHETPRFDSLASEGVLFERAYAAAPNCSPARAAMLTGRWPARLGLTTYLNDIRYPFARFIEPAQPAGLPLEETTLAELLKSQGYATGGIGKWHLGDGEFLPPGQGFDVSARGRDLRKKWGRAPDEITTHEFRAALDFIRAHKDVPFFLYLPLHAPHPPVTGKEDDVRRFQEKDPEGQAEYAAILAEVDRELGLFTFFLDEMHLLGRTFLILTSDNGGTERAHLGGLRGGKGKLLEGGLRVPLIAWGPGLVRGKRIEQAVCGVDLFPTVLDLLGLEPPAELQLDGVSLAPLLRGEREALADRSLYWHFPHRSADGSGRPGGALLDGSTKLIEYFDDGSLALFDLATDPGERRNLARARAAEAKQLHGRLAAWRSSTGALLPEPNPDHRPGREGVRELPDRTKRRNEKNRSTGEENPDG